ncbi:hypothetical protein HOC80_05490 [archaeon]|jgi:hypothetical protein|nr:hypothetical protein [archaeon]MBT4417526.1 hypothetical protein [archaeon]
MVSVVRTIGGIALAVGLGSAVGGCSWLNENYEKADRIEEKAAGADKVLSSAELVQMARDLGYEGVIRHGDHIYIDSNSLKLCVAGSCTKLSDEVVGAYLAEKAGDDDDSGKVYSTVIIFP